ncbi:MAG: hypothetical protein SFV23_14305 [Planctomycetaceae bacterium]|nr:hypothetical protein [Planctomycetaceae bacterium]
MAATREELDQFHQFAIAQLDTGTAHCELDELLVTWCDSLERETISQVLRSSLADLDAGRGRPAREVTAELQAKYGLTAK